MVLAALVLLLAVTPTARKPNTAAGAPCATGAAAATI
jgi:hypothetical protein